VSALFTVIKRTLKLRLHSAEHSCSAVQPITIDMCLDNLLVFAGSQGRRNWGGSPRGEAALSLLPFTRRGKGDKGALSI
jgi:hypothetical protein